MSPQLRPSENWLKRAACLRPWGYIKAQLQLGTNLKGLHKSRVPCGIRYLCCDCITAQLPLPSFASFTSSLVLSPRALPSKPSMADLHLRGFCGDLNLHHSSPIQRVGGLPLFSCVAFTPPSLHVITVVGTWTHHVLQFLIPIAHQNLSPVTTEDGLEESRGDPSLTTLLLQCMERMCLGSPPHLLQWPVGSMILWDSTGKL